MPRFLVSLAVFGFFSVATPPGFTQDAYENLHVLPKDVTEDELSASMLENLRGLGLRRPYQLCMMSSIDSNSRFVGDCG